MVIYEALYNHMIHESSYETISIHKTEQGARNALAKKIKEEHEDYNKMYRYDVNEMVACFGRFEAWCINETKLLG